MYSSVLDAGPLQMYSAPEIWTDPGRHVAAFGALPVAVRALVEVVQGLVLDPHWAPRLGVRLSPEHRADEGIRSVEEQVQRILEMDPRPLTVARPAQRRLAANSRGAALLLCAMLRHQGVPARLRCGFATYVRPLQYDGRCLVEYWDAPYSRWALVDAQLDTTQCRALGIAFDPLDVPSQRFLTAGVAWLACRVGQADPARFAVGDVCGMAQVRSSVVRDLAALNNVELLPWDTWGPMARNDADAATSHVDLIDRLARLTIGCDELSVALRQAYNAEARLYGTPERLAAPRALAVSARG